METSKLEFRMYGLVPYNISPIQQAIQYGHAVVEYMVEYRDQPDLTKWAEEDKTFIILNGGTTNSFQEKGTNNPVGSLNKHLDTLMLNEVKVARFLEPDLGNQLTAVVFLADERVWNKEKYPEFIDSIYYSKTINSEYNIETLNNLVYKQWVESIGGEYILWLRNFLKQFRLA